MEGQNCHLGMEWKVKDAQLQQVCNQVSETRCAFEGPVGAYFEISSNELIKLIFYCKLNNVRSNEFISFKYTVNFDQCTCSINK